MKHILAFLAMLVLAMQTPAVAQQPTQIELPKALVYKVYDGDGCRVRLADGTIRRIRFAGVDAPEFANVYTTTYQTFAKESRDSLRGMILGKYIYLDTLPFGKVKRSYGRLVANVFTTDTVPQWLNHYIVFQGWAWSVFTDKWSDDQGYQIREAQAGAIADKRGLWGKPGKKITPAWHRKKFRRVPK